MRAPSSLVFIYIGLATTFAGCAGKIDSPFNTTPKPKPDREIAISEEIPRIVGTFTAGQAGELTIHADGTYAALTYQEISFRTGGPSPTRDYYAMCRVSELGRFDLFRRNDHKHFRFHVQNADVVDASFANRGTREFDPKEICTLFAQARLKQPLVQQYEAIGMAPSLALSVKLWPHINAPSYKNEKVTFSKITDTPYAVGTLYSLKDKPVEVTSLVSRLLQGAEIPKTSRPGNKWPGEDFSYDAAAEGAGRFTFISNRCAFAVEMKARVMANNGELAIFPVDLVITRDIDTEASRSYADYRGDADSRYVCARYRSEFKQENVVKHGIALKFASWMMLQVRFGFREITKILPEPLASEDRDKVML